MPKHEPRTSSNPTCIYKQAQPKTDIVNRKAICTPPKTPAGPGPKKRY